MYFKAMTSSIPLIGVTLDYMQGDHACYSAYPWLAIRQNYMGIVSEAGGLPVGLPPIQRKIPELLDRLSGVVITGGAFDIHPHFYNETNIHPKTVLNESRNLFEYSLLKEAWQRNMPILGICGGAQLIAVFREGNLYQHIPDDIPQALPHEQINPAHQASHIVTLNKESLLYKITKKTQWAVNSSHHQAIRNPGRCVISAIAEDHIIEAIEDPSRDFCIGVQWHPEFAVEYADRQIFSAFIAKAKLYEQSRP